MPGNYSRVEVAEGTDGRVRLRCSGGCSALHLAVVLDLELDEFERWDEPRVSRPPVAPVTRAKSSTPARPKPRKSQKRTSSVTPYDRLLALVQTVLDAESSQAQVRAIREGHRVALSLTGVDPAHAEAALTAAAREVGISPEQASAIRRGDAT